MFGRVTEDIKRLLDSMEPIHEEDPSVLISFRNCFELLISKRMDISNTPLRMFVDAVAKLHANVNSYKPPVPHQSTSLFCGKSISN